MNSSAIRGCVEELCEVLLLAEPDAAGVLKQAASSFVAIGRWAAGEGLPAVSQACESAAALLDQCGGRPAKEISAVLDIATRASATLQRICDGSDPAHVPFPSELQVSDAEGGESSGDSGGSTAKIDVELLEAFVQEAGEHLEAIESYLVAKPGTQGEEAIHGVFRAFHTIKGAAAFLNFEDIGRVAHEMENLLERVRRGEAPLDEKAVDLTLESTDVLKSLILGLRDSVKKGHRAVADRRVTPLVERIRSLIGGTPGLAERKPSAAPVVPPEEPGLHAAITSDTIRVDAERLDRLLDTIGELVIAESMVSQSVAAARNDSREMEAQLRQLDKITRSLQEMSTSLRMVSIRPVFVRMARLVRDLAKRARKPIDFVTSGEDTELDKGIVDHMVDPLIHLLRNAVDHGLEPSPAARRAAGKPDAGRIELHAYHRAGSICVEVLDDGRGLDRAKIRNRAVERGLIAPDAAVTDAELVNLIFEPSFSTADVVTEVSGRGVGMDVVRRNVEALRGQIEVSSEPGKGCRVTVRLPLSLAIIDGMVIRVGSEERYIVPTLSIVRTVCLQAEDISSIIERGEMFMMEGHLVPLYRLHDLFNVAGGGAGGNGTLLVLVVEDSGRQLGLAVDELLGQQQIVIKGIGDYIRDTPGIAGGAIMPDGRVGLILDVGGLVRGAHNRGVRTEAARPETDVQGEGGGETAVPPRIPESENAGREGGMT